MAVLLIIWLGMAAICTNSARKRGRSAALWGVLGVLFGLFALIALYLLPPSETESAPTGVTTHSTITATPADGDLDRLAKLHALLHEGALSPAEYEVQKNQILGYP
jgi:hypothetical protein